MLITDGINYQENQSANSFIIKYLLKYIHEENINKINQQSQPNNYIFNYLTSNNSIISKLFCGFTNINWVCPGCNSMGNYTKECYFLEFYMSKIGESSKQKNLIPWKNNPDIDLYECFEYNKNINNKYIKDGIFCYKCKRAVDIIFGSNNLAYLPKYLIINLNREIMNIYKGNVTIHENLDLSKYLMYTNSIPTMKLYAVICSDKPGHFVAFCKNETTNEWNCYDDYNVTKCSEPEPYKKGKAYVLFYHASQN